MAEAGGASDPARPRPPERLRRALAGGPAARLCFAPGRINLIGDHVDYLGGTVLPVSLDRGTWFALRPAGSLGLHVRALDEDAAVHFAAPPGGEATGDWRDFVRGVLVETGIDPGALALELVVTGELAGGGLSSSASFCVGLLRSLGLAGALPEQAPEAVARLAQRIEHRYLGVPCGLMDPLAVAAGREDGALRIDCATGRCTPLRLPWTDPVLLAIHSGVARRLGDGAYARRREELAAGLRALGLPEDRLPEAPALERLGPAADPGRRRVRHVITEQRRVLDALDAVSAGDPARFGALLDASHGSLRDDFEVSVPALDALVAAARTVPGCLGARLTGAGFGGWALALVREAAVPAVLSAVEGALGRPLLEDAPDGWFRVRPGGAARPFGTLAP
ncbi:MAG: galactokinase family protein [Pseudomonadales bacterium]|nr:galactokinase family protein [Pseudomonadales bacterium]